MKRFVLLLTLCFIAMSDSSAHAVVVASDDFDGGDVNLLAYSQSVDDNTAPPGDMFGVRSRSSIVNGVGLPFAISDDSVSGAAGNSTFASDTQGIFGQAKTDAFFGVVDLVGPFTPGTATATWTFDISGFKNLALSIDAGAMGDFEDTTTSGTDQYTFSVSIDGGPSQTIFEFISDTSASHTYLAMDSGAAATLNDPLILAGAGTVLDKSDPATGALPTFTGSIAGAGSQLVLTFFATTDGGSEAFAFDNIVISSAPPVPEPATVGLLLLSAVGLGTRGRRAAR